MENSVDGQCSVNNLEILNRNYDKVIVPQRVVREILAKGRNRVNAKIFLENQFITKIEKCFI